jgi:hypothetical protein
LAHELLESEVVVVSTSGVQLFNVETANSSPLIHIPTLRWVLKCKQTEDFF